MPSRALSPDQVESSPSSSVFDIPTHTYPLLESRPQISLQAGEVDEGSYVVISGGTGCNAICSAFGRNTCYVLPVSDDGGSSSEIIRVIGGPSIGERFAVLIMSTANNLSGDIRSRLIRLIPPTPPASPLSAIRALLAHRFAPDLSDREARDEWRSIVEGKSDLWHGIPPDRKEAIRAFLVYFESDVLRRAHKNFSFRNGSIGNYLLAAAQGFFRSLPSAIFFFSSITSSQAHILPVLVTNHTVTIAAELEDHSLIVGQCNISHPIRLVTSGITAPASDVHLDSVENQSVPVQPRNVGFSKETHDATYDPLPARISRVFYINAYGNEISPTPNPEFLTQLERRNVLIYSCGSLWTSIMPCLALPGVGQAIACSRTLKFKVLLLNSKNDRETHGYTAMDYIHAISATLRASYVTHSPTARENLNHPISAFITHLVFLKGTLVPVDGFKIHTAGVKCIEVDNDNTTNGVFNATAVLEALREILYGD